MTYRCNQVIMAGWQDVKEHMDMMLKRIRQENWTQDDVSLLKLSDNMLILRAKRDLK